MARERKFSMDELFQATRQLLLKNGYEGFTFSLLADQLEVSRGTIYKYFENKDELIAEFMIYEMNQFLKKLKEIDLIHGFDAQFDFLVELIFEDTEIHKMIEMGQQLKENTKGQAKEDNEKLDNLQLEMYRSLHHFIQLGRNEKRIKPHLPDGLILGFIFQTVAIPNHFNVPYDDWVKSIKEILRDGLLVK